MGVVGVAIGKAMMLTESENKRQSARQKDDIFALGFSRCLASGRGVARL